MYAIVRTGGKQYRIKAGDKIRVELLEKSPGDEFSLKEILFVGGKKSYLGEPILPEAKVKALVTRQKGKTKKILVFKKKRRKGYRKTQGHRQLFTELFIKSISDPDGESVTAEFKEESGTKSSESKMKNHNPSEKKQNRSTRVTKKGSEENIPN